MKYETNQRKQLLAFLREHADETFSAAQLAVRMAGEGISRSAVYRNLADLEADGLIRRVAQSGSKRSCYRYLGAAECKDHLHLSCSRCGAIYHMDHPATHSLIDSVMQDSDFAVDSGATVLYGVCARCRKA